MRIFAKGNKTRTCCFSNETVHRWRANRANRIIRISRLTIRSGIDPSLSMMRSTFLTNSFFFFFFNLRKRIKPKKTIHGYVYLFDDYVKRCDLTYAIFFSRSIRNNNNKDKTLQRKRRTAPSFYIISIAKRGCKKKKRRIWRERFRDSPITCSSSLVGRRFGGWRAGGSHEYVRCPVRQPASMDER